jgi:hypothetical protein
MDNIKRKIKEENLTDRSSPFPLIPPPPPISRAQAHSPPVPLSLLAPERTIMTKIAANVKGEGLFASLGFSSLPSLPSTRLT